MKFAKTDYKHVLMNFDMENQYIEQLLGFSLPQFPPDAGFYFNVLLNCDEKYHLFENYMEMYAMHVNFKPRVIEITETIWYNLVQICYQDKVIFIDGEMRATELPIGANKRFTDVWYSDIPYYDEYIRKELLP